MNSRVLRLATASIFAGILIGVVGAAFRYLLVAADHLRTALVRWAHAWPHSGWLAPVALGITGAALARFLVVRYAPLAAGSGVQRVEAVFDGEARMTRQAIVPVKFFGGLLAMGSGLALGREGPTVQMGASLGAWVTRFLIKEPDDVRVVHAAGAGAGLAVAFNAPIGGSIFVFEELTSSFTPWLLIATLAAALVAVWVMRLLLGNALDFQVQQISAPEAWKLVPFLAVGALLGIVGALYNALTVTLLRLTDALTRLSSVKRAALIGAAVGVAAWFAPTLVGGGDSLTQAVLTDQFAGRALVGIVLMRFLIGPWSYAAGTPGGLFAPLLVLGASCGALFAQAVNHLAPGLGLSPINFAVVGMAALFSASVRAPLTGLVLTVEMTGRGDLTLGLLGASMAAMVVATLLNSEPVYESLKRRMLQQEGMHEENIADKAGAHSLR